MAGGFWSGFLHGGAICAVALAGWSLLTPTPRATSVPAPVDQVRPTAAMPRPSLANPSATLPPPATPVPAPMPANAGGAADLPASHASGGRRTGPETTEIDLPPGSEFGRGGDLVPPRPQPLIGPEAPGLPALVATAPLAELAPRAETSAEARPVVADEIGAAANGPSQPPIPAQEPARESARPDPVVSLASPSRAARPTPPAPDAPASPAEMSASMSGARQTAPTTTPAGERPRDLDPPSAGSASGPDAAPVSDAAPPGRRPVPDLSLPPDLTELGHARRNP